MRGVKVWMAAAALLWLLVTPAQASEPVPGADVEVELYNKDKKYEAPNEYMVTQVVKADANGVFTYAVPFAGWWGFAALNTADEKLDHDGTPKNVELGAVRNYKVFKAGCFGW